MNIKEIFDIISKKEGVEFTPYKMYTPKTKFYVLDENSEKVQVTGMVIKDEPTFIIKTTLGEIHVADEHAVVTEQGQKFVKDLKKGDKLKNANGIAEVLEIIQGEKELVYDLAVQSETHLYQDSLGFIHHNTFHVEKTLQDMFGSPEGAGAKWRYRQGAKLSPMGLYQDLFANKDDLVIVYDDSDSVWSDKDAINMLKSALDTKKTRILTWISPRTQNVDLLSPEEKEDYYETLYTAMREHPEDVGTKIKLPSTFKFTSRVIFISNLKAAKFEQGDMAAIASRSLFMDINLSREGVIQRMYSILPFVSPEISMDEKKQVVEQLSQGGKELSMRAVLAGIAVKTAGFSDWDRLAAQYAGR